jgi:rRNA processing protein Krr1/Pno1
MTHDNHAEVNVLQSKKEMKRAVADKLQVALPEMISTLGEKKFNRRLKKAVKMLLHGIHSDEVLKKAERKADANKAASAKKMAAKKVKAAKKMKKAKAAVPELL